MIFVRRRMFYFHSCVAMFHLMEETHPTLDLHLISELVLINQMFKRQGIEEEEEDKAQVFT